MDFIRTVLGDVDISEIGHTQCHEHLFIEQDKSAEVAPVLLIDDLDKSTKELVSFKKAGGSAIVDAQPVLAGRMAEWLVEASKKSDVSIIASTGFHKTVFYYDDSYIFNKPEEEIADLYEREIKKGMLSSKKSGAAQIAACAGLIKTAVDVGGIKADKTYEKLHTAAAEAQKRTGAPLMCHIEQGADAKEVVEFYLNSGVVADKIWIAHLDRAKYDENYHVDVFTTGVYLEYDTIARDKYHSDEDELKLIVKMIEAGYCEKILLSLDTTRARLRNYGADMGLDYILKKFIPYMEANGITSEQIKSMTVQNPRKALAMSY